MGSLQNKIENYLQDNGISSSTEICKELERDKRQVWHQLRQLKKYGIVEEVPTPKRSVPNRWKLKS